MATQKKDVHKTIPPHRGGSQVKLGEMALTSKLEHLKAHGPLSHYRSLLLFTFPGENWLEGLFFVGKKWLKSHKDLEVFGEILTNKRVDS